MASLQRSMARQAVRDFGDLIRRTRSNGAWWQRFRGTKPTPPWKLRNGKPKKKARKAA